MFWTLFVKECKEMLRSITYYLFLIGLLCFFLTQMGSFGGISKPRPGQESYGQKYSDDPVEIMSSTMIELMREYITNSYDTYPAGFDKEIRLSEKEQEEVLEIMDQILIPTKEEILKVLKDENGNPADIMHFSKNLTYEQFVEYMSQINELLGKGSKYAEWELKENAITEMTYEDAIKEYEDTVVKDQVSRAYARLFCDYIGIVMGILPVFLAVSRVHRDRRSKAAEVIYSKRCSSLLVVVSRYAATVCMSSLPVLLLSINPLLQSMYCAKSNGVHGDWFAFLKLSCFWVLPIILITVSIGYFLTELTQGPLAILLVGVWWYFSVFMNGGKMIGEAGMRLIPRFNTFGAHDEYVKMLPSLIPNRLCYSGIAILLLLASVLLFDLKRKGVLHQNGTLFHHRKG